MVVSAFPFPTFQPAMRIITAITNDLEAEITTSFAHQYVTGMIVRLNIPLGFGMLQANQKYAPITVTGTTTFTMPLDTSQFDVFAVPVTFPLDQQKAQVTVIGEVNELLSAAERNVLPYPLQS